MPVERSAGIIFFRDTPHGRLYLVLRSTPSREYPDHWDVSKGVLNAKETGIDGALREAKEETNITDATIVEGFKYTARYFRRDRDEHGVIPKFVALFLARTAQQTVTLSWEHDRFEWLPYDAAHARLSNNEIKKALASAEEFLSTVDRHHQ